MKTKSKNLVTLEEFKDKNFGPRGTKFRKELEGGYKAFKRGVIDSGKVSGKSRNY